jgi:hypothetical protein
MHAANCVKASSRVSGVPASLVVPPEELPLLLPLELEVEPPELPEDEELLPLPPPLLPVSPFPLLLPLPVAGPPLLEW